MRRIGHCLSHTALYGSREDSTARAMGHLVPCHLGVGAWLSSKRVNRQDKEELNMDSGGSRLACATNHSTTRRELEPGCLHNNYDLVTNIWTATLEWLHVYREG